MLAEAKSCFQETPIHFHLLASPAPQFFSPSSHVRSGTSRVPTFLQTLLLNSLNHQRWNRKDTKFPSIIAEILDLGNHGSSSLLLKDVRFRNGRGRNTFSLLSTVKDEIVSRNEISIDYCNYEKFSIWEIMDLLPSCWSMFDSGMEEVGILS